MRVPPWSGRILPAWVLGAALWAPSEYYSVFTVPIRYDLLASAHVFF